MYVLIEVPTGVVWRLPDNAKVVVSPTGNATWYHGSVCKFYRPNEWTFDFDVVKRRLIEAGFIPPKSEFLGRFEAKIA